MHFKSLLSLGAILLSLGLSAQESTPWHLQGETNGVAAVEAHKMIAKYGSLEPQTVVVAVLDGGTDVLHEDLADVVWVNADEIPDNGIDDDGNGYIDDVHGWSMLSGPEGEISSDNMEMVRIERDYRAREAEGEKLTKEEKKLLTQLSKSRQKELKKAKRMQRQMRSMEKAANGIIAHCGEDYTVGCVESYKEEAKGFMTKLWCRVIVSLKNSGWSNYQIDQQLFAGFRQFNDHVNYHYNSDFNPMDSVQGELGDHQLIGPFAEHGTHVAGIIAATHDNEMGTKGVAQNVQIMVLRVVPNGDERDELIAEAIRYAVDNGATIINMSFGKYHSANPEIVDDATRYAEIHDVLMVHAAGNEATDLDKEVCYPNSVDEQSGRQYPHWIEVGASTIDGTPASFSNYGDYVDVFAPGKGIFSTMPDNHYLENDGTSMAAPVVSGVAAVLRGLFPELSAAQIREILMRSAVVTDEDVVIPGKKKKTAPFSEMTASGIVNLEQAIRLAKTYVPGGSPESED